MKKLVTATLAGAFLLSSSLAFADRIEDAQDYREGIFHALKWHFGPLAAMAKGKMPYDAKMAQHHADMMVVLSPMVPEGFIEGSQGGDAKDEIWEDPEEFQEHAMELDKAVADLKSAAGSLDTLKPAVAAVGKSCKGCHDEFRED